MSNIKDLPYFERPYEKLIFSGESSLTDSELLSIIIRNGTKENSALEIAQKLLNYYCNEFNNLSFIQELTLDEFQKIDGIGLKKAIELKAIGEISKRIFKPFNPIIQIKNPSDIIKLFVGEMQNEKNEILKTILLNNKNIIKRIVTIAVGNENNISVNIKAILSEAIKDQAPKIVIVHNHPSGDSTPSKEDINFTKKVKEAAKLLDIELLDHIVIGNGNYKTISC